ncbi:LysR family transcriptional regulator [Photobacterium rosenbergii]|uniref:LysR family transcriptional regulator n=1 Tax=Photobacterium rosenbergii TaxID=294936 RepID=A0A2T3NF78_9GAMM|nr:LysR family transcriptional regulator [Photobacterium rosenbergii]PSW13171.1 LysR family transcriptional regulator [Photobacterium rosenbergii]
MKTEDIKLFHKVVEFGSISESAKWMDLPKSNISRRIKQLEEDTGIKLFHRHSRNVTLTESGNRFYISTVSIIKDLDQTVLSLQTPEDDLQGKLKIMIMPVMLNKAQLVLDFMTLHPNIDVEVISSPYEQDLIKNNIDMAFRLSNKVSEENLVAREMARETFGLYASPQYIAEYGEPQSLEDLVEHLFIVYRFSNGQIFDKVTSKNGNIIQPKSSLTVNSILLMIEAATQHKGVLFTSRRIGKQFVEKGLLQLIIPTYAPIMNLSWLVHPPRHFMSREGKAFLDFVLERQADLLYPDSELIDVLRTPFNTQQ